MSWGASPFESLYNSIDGGNLDINLLKPLIPDLSNLNLNGDKVKNPTSRSKLEADEVELPDGNTYKLSKNFIYAAIQLSDAMNLDELICCQLVVSSLPDLDALNSISNSIISLVRNGKVQYFIRRQYILQIVSYIVNCVNTNDAAYKELTKSGELVKNILAAFNSIHVQLSEIKQTINKAQILETYDVLFQQDVKFKRDFLLKEYDTLSQILFGLVEQGHFNTKDAILQIIQHVAELDSNDYFIVYYLPSIFHAFRMFGKLFPENEVFGLHKHFLSELRADTIYKKPVKVTIIFVFLSFFIVWCKESPETRTARVDFKTDIDEPMTSAVELGAIEQLLIISADTSIIEKTKSIELYYNIRLLLERHIPRLIPKQLIDNETAYINSTTADNIATNPMMINGRLGVANKESPLSKAKYQFHEVQLSETTSDMFASAFHSVLQTIINDCAFLLTKIKDAEEDSLMSGEDLNLDDICVKADLERFFITIHYFYAARPEYSEEFWNDRESNTYGFIEWASKSKDILIRSCFYLMVASLSFGSKNVLDVFHYFGENSTVSWTLIANCIKDYVLKIGNLNNVIQERQRLQDTSDVNNTEVALEEGLNEETIIFLSSLFTLIGSVASEVDESIKQTLSSLFTDILFEFVKLDTPLAGACFKTLSCLVPQETSMRSKFWFSLDSLIFKSYSLTSSSNSYRAALGSFLSTFTEVQGFLHLFDKLTIIDQVEGDMQFLKFGTLQYPSKLGQSYRKAGIWPYYDYILNDVFFPLTRIDNENRRRSIYKPTLNIIKNALYSFDYSVILNSSKTGADLDKLVVSDNFITYVQESAAPAIFNYLFTDKVYMPLLEVIEFGVDQLSIDLEGGDEQLHLIELAVTILDTALEYQNTYIEEFIPIFKNQRRAIFFTPKDVGLHGLRNFYDALFFNLTVIPHLGLYVGVDHHNLAAKALSVLDKLTNSSNTALPEYSMCDKTLTILDSVDESSRIKDAFMTQIDSSITSDHNLELKIKILNFLSTRLSYTSDKITVSHLLLGFQVSDVISDGPDLSTFIKSGNSLFNSIATLLVSSLQVLTRRSIDYAPMRLANLCIEILLKICRNPLTSDITFSYLEQLGLFDCLLKLDPDVTKFTLFNGRVFDDKSISEEREFLNSKSMGSLLSFLSYKTYLVQFLSRFIHRVSFSGTESQVNACVSRLISNTIYSAKIFSFFDTLNYPRVPLEQESTQSIKTFSDLTIDLTTISIKDLCDDEVFDFSSVEKLAKLYIDSRLPAQSTSMVLVQKDGDPRKKILSEAESELQIIKKNVTCLLYNKLSEEYQLSILHSWVQLVQIIVTDGKLDSIARSKFILEVFTAVIPKLNDYVEFDISFSEELVSLVVFLYEIYGKDRLEVNQHETMDSRLSDIFRLCIHGILSPMTSVALRSDFYTLINQYLVQVLKDRITTKEVSQTIRMNCEQFVHTVCNDAIYGQGTNRITSILLLDSLVQMGSMTPENFVLECLTKSAQLHLIIRSMKNLDNMLDSDPYQISIDDLLYEITTFKTTVFFLIRIAETRAGAKALVENKIFQVIESCSFLKIDPDLGMNLVFDEVQMNNSKFAKTNISLDNHVFVENNTNCISLFELISPIFQLLSCILVSSGDQNKGVISSTRSLLVTLRKLLVGIFKRDALSDADIYKNQEFPSEALELLVKLSVVLCTLTGYRGEEKSAPSMI